MEKISWTNNVKNEEVLHRDNAERNILHTINRRTGNWIGDMFRDCLLKHVIEGKIEERIRREGRSKHLLDDINPLNTELNPICQ